MALSNKNKNKIMFLWKEENKGLWMETFLKVADKNGNIVPFRLTREQKYFIDNMQRENIIEKSRQLGISTITIGLSIRECIIYENRTCLLVSHNQESCNNIFDKLKQMFDSLPDFIKPKLLTNNRQELKFPNGSKITCVTAGNKEIGRGATLNGIVHLSEFAFWKNPEKHLKSLGQAVSDKGTIIIESTANGFNEFSDIYLKAKNKENSYKSFFFNWINGSSLFESAYKQARLDHINIHGKELSKEELDEEELHLIELGASMNQLMWRRKKISTDGIDAFHVEYPSDDTECFLVTGKGVFDTSRINKLLVNNNFDKTIKPVSIHSILKTHINKSLTIWHEPQTGMKYYIGVDCSEGNGADYHVCTVLDKNGIECAEFRNNKIKPYQLAEILNQLGRYYNKALVTVEKASGGYSVIERLRNEYKYMNMTKYKTFDEFNRAVYKIGFDTNAKTKSIAINDLCEWFDTGNLKINSKTLLNEMKVYIQNDNGSMGAVSGEHDDTVMSMAIAIQGIKLNVFYKW